MNFERPIPKELCERILSAAQAALPSVFEQPYRRIEQPRREVAELKARLKVNSTNSSKPAFSDPPSVKPATPNPPSAKKRGGQAEHEAHHRAIAPPQKGNESFDIKPEVCRCRGQVMPSLLRLSPIGSASVRSDRRPPTYSDPFSDTA